MKKSLLVLAVMTAVFLAAYFMPIDKLGLGEGPVYESLAMLQDYAQKHVLTCLVPAFFIAGGIAVFVSKASVMKYFGPAANRVLAYGVAAVSGSILAVCSCTVLPLFSGIHKRGAGLGPAITFLYAGPAINVLAVIMTARVLGWEFGVGRAVGAIAFSIIIGLLMHLIFLREERKRAAGDGFVVPEDGGRPLWQQAAFFAAMIGLLVFANWGEPGDIEIYKKDGSTVSGVRVERTDERVAVEDDSGERHVVERDEIDHMAYAPSVYSGIYSARYFIGAGFLVVVLLILRLWFKKDEVSEWVGSSWGFAKQILPLLFIGVVVAGVLLGRPGHQALIPMEWIEYLVGGNSLWANLFASVSGALMYFATLTEVPILDGLRGLGMGNGPAMALLLAGPALSLPNMLVIRGVLGTKKTIVYVSLVVAMATISGMIFGFIY